MQKITYKKTGYCLAKKMMDGSFSIINSIAEFIWRMFDSNNDIVNLEDIEQDTYLVKKQTILIEDQESIIQSFDDLGIFVYT